MHTLQLTLRPTIPADLHTLFEHQADDDYAHIAAFMNENFKDRDAYLAKWNRLLGVDTVNSQTILLDGEVAGSVGTWDMDGEAQITYGVAKELWGKGIVTRALQQFLQLFPARPLYGRVAFDNVGSMRVLEKCGFKKIGEDKHHAHTRGGEIVEIIFILEG